MGLSSWVRVQRVRETTFAQDISYLDTPTAPEQSDSKTNVHCKTPIAPVKVKF